MKLFFDTDWMAIITQWAVSLCIILVVKRCFATRTYQPTPDLMNGSCGLYVTPLL
ncbi:hypothetical protein BC941DRAFT_432918, partial [Chlamydoabsidia padenii]